MTTSKHNTLSSCDDLRRRAKALALHGLVSRWDEFVDQPWLPTIIDIEEAERRRRSLERRLRTSRLGRFKPIADFDWSWPKHIDHELIDEILTLGFLAEAGNVLLVGPGGVGKTTIAQNIGHQALLRGHTVLRVTASEMLNDLAAQDSTTSMARRLRRYVHPTLLILDELGYLSYDARAGDLLYEVVSRRHELKSTIVTTNRAFREWNLTFPQSSCVSVIVDRLTHRCEIVRIDADSYRAKEAKERSEQRAQERQRRRKSDKAGGA